MSTPQPQKNTGHVERPPIVAVLGHIDHGKSTLLDFIRKTNTTAGEAGGITQRIAAYAAVHRTENGEEKPITFIDTPGHEAFGGMRARGANAADIVILIVSAEDGVKAQTLEALTVIKESGTPYLVAVNKTDSDKANTERTLDSLTQHGVFLEGRGGDVPFALVSAKTGAGVSELIETLLLMAELAELRGDPDAPAEGVVIESHRDKKRGIGAVLVVKNGTLKTGMFVQSGSYLAPVRLLENTVGERMIEASLSMPAVVVGWDGAPAAGDIFRTFDTKKEAERACSTTAHPAAQTTGGASGEPGNAKTLNVVIKASDAGAIDAVRHELAKLPTEHARLVTLESGIGAISLGDIKNTGLAEGDIALGFNVAVETDARDYAERAGILTHTSPIIYELAEFVANTLATYAPDESESARGAATILKTFSRTKRAQVVGGKVAAGTLRVRDTVSILRRDTAIGSGRILELQKNRTDAQTVSEGDEFGAKIEAVPGIVAGDTLSTAG